MAFEFTDDEPKLTTKLRSEVTEPEPAEFTPKRPAELIVEQEEPIVASEDKEERFKEPKESTEIAKVEERKPKPKKVGKSMVTRKAPAEKEPDGKSISQLQNELRKHSDARKKSDSAILDIRKELKDLLLVHHATIKDLQKQVAHIHKKIATIDSSKKSTKSKRIGTKTVSRRKKVGSSKKSKNSTNIRKNSRKR